MPPSLDQARAALAAQPFSRLLGAQLNRFGPDGVELQVPVRPAHRQQHGFANGGLLGYAADNALTFAAGAVADPEVLTAAYTINVLAPSSATACLSWSSSAASRLRPRRSKSWCCATSSRSCVASIRDLSCGLRIVPCWRR